MIAFLILSLLHHEGMLMHCFRNIHVDETNEENETELIHLLPVQFSVLLDLVVYLSLFQGT